MKYITDDLEARVHEVLERPSMFAATLPALESLLFGLLSLRGDWLGRPNARHTYQRAAINSGMRLAGSDTAFSRFPLDADPNAYPEALAFYRV